MGDGVEEVVEGVRGGIGGRVRGEMQDYGLCGAGPEMALVRESRERGQVGQTRA